jgi:hypothetical protein
VLIAQLQLLIPLNSHLPSGTRHNPISIWPLLKAYSNLHLTKSGVMASHQHWHTASDGTIASIRSTDSDMQIIEPSSSADGEITQYGTSGDGHPDSLVDCLRMQFPTALLNPASRSTAFVVHRRNQVDWAFCPCHRQYQSYKTGKMSTTGLKAGTMLWKCCAYAEPCAPLPSPWTK